MDALARHHVKVAGRNGGRPVVFAHGLGCHQIVWRHILPGFQHEYQTVQFDQIGHGSADPDAYDPVRHGALAGYADDLLAILEQADLRHVIYVGNSVGAMIGVLAAARQPERFAALVLIAASPRFINDHGYEGGFTEAQIHNVLEGIDRDWDEWSQAMTPDILGNRDNPNVAAQLTYGFCRTDPRVIKHFARAAFLCDVRAALPQLAAPCLILQCARDVFAPPSVGEYMRDQIPDSELIVIDTTGHVPHLTAPAKTGEIIRSFLDRRGLSGIPARM